MNTKKMATSIIIAMVVTVIFAATATAIVVDGDCSDWTAESHVKDDPANDPAGIHGYDLEALYLHYNSGTDTLYARLDVYGKPADLDGNSDTDTVCDIPPGDCPGVGPEEQYYLKFKSTGKPGTYIKYTDNAVKTGGGGAGAAKYGANCIEFSLSQATSYINPHRYCINVTAGGMADLPGEDMMSACVKIEVPPVANFTFIAGDCNQTVWFDASGSYDDQFGGIVSYTWDFGDSTGEVRYDNYSFAHTFPVAYGTYDVNLTITDTDDLTDSLVRTVTVNREPIVSSVTANKTEVDYTGGWVRFTGSGSDLDGDLLAYEWSVTDASGTHVVKTGTFTTPYPFSDVIDYFVSSNATARLTVTDAHGCTDHRTSPTVGVPVGCPPPVADADSPYRRCVGYPVRFDGSGSSSSVGGITEYCWDVDNDGVYEYCGSNPVYVHTYPGTYTGIAVLNVTDPCGSDIDTAQVIVEECPEKVPVLTPAGILGLTGLLCIIGATRIMRRK